jgi:hypothetical protein
MGLEIQTNAGVKTIRHGGSIDGFNSHLAYVPDQQIAVIVLSNVEGVGAAAMGSQLLDVALGKPAFLVNEHQPVAIASVDLLPLAGTFQFSSSFSLTFQVDGDHLSASAPGESALPLTYEGIRSGHPTFYAQSVFAELEFVKDASGKIETVILHQAGHDETGHRR